MAERDIGSVIKRGLIIVGGLGLATVLPWSKAHAEDLRLNAGVYCDGGSPVLLAYPTGIMGDGPIGITIDGMTEAYPLRDSLNPRSRRHEPIPLKNGEVHTVRLFKIDSVNRVSGMTNVTGTIIFTEKIEAPDCNDPLSPSRYEV